MRFDIFRKWRKGSLEIVALAQEKEGLQSEIATHEAKIKSLENQIEKLKLRRKIEDEDIRHMVKMREEQLALEFERKVIETDSKKEAEISTVKDAYRDKIEKFLEKQVEDIKEMYGQILQRLPDVNVKLKGKI